MLFCQLKPEKENTASHNAICCESILAHLLIAKICKCNLSTAFKQERFQKWHWNGYYNVKIQVHNIIIIIRKCFEPRSNMPWLKMMIWVTRVLRSTIVEWRFHKLCRSHLQSHLTLKMASEQVVETSVTNNSPKDSNHPDDHFQSGILLLGSNHFLIN